MAISTAYRSFCTGEYCTLGFDEYLPDEVYMLLDLKVVSQLLSFDD